MDVDTPSVPAGAGPKRRFRPDPSWVTAKKKLRYTKHRVHGPMTNVGAGIMEDQLGLVPRLMSMPPFILNKRGPLSKLPTGPKQTTTWRYQTLGKNPKSSGAQDLAMFDANDRAGTIADPYKDCYCPVIAYNLTSCPIGTFVTDGTGISAGTRLSVPGYRLRRVFGADTNAGATFGFQNYSWDALPGYNNHPVYSAFTYPWQFTKKSDQTSKYDTPLYHHFKHHYTKMDFTFVGAAKSPTRVELQFVRFKKGLGPKRACTTPLNTVTISAYQDRGPEFETKKEVEEHDTHWDQYLAPRIKDFNHQPTNVPCSKPYMVISKRTVDLCTTSTTDPNADFPCRCNVTVMLKNGGVYFSGYDSALVTANNTRFVSDTPLESVDTNTKRYGYVTQGIDQVNQFPGMFADYEDDIWLLINGVGESLTTVRTPPVYTFPSYDLRMVGKWTTLNQSYWPPAAFLNLKGSGVDADVDQAPDPMKMTVGQILDVDPPVEP